MSRITITNKGRDLIEHMRRADAWYDRNRAAVDRWLVSHPPDGPYGGCPHYYAYAEMPNPETVIGRILLRLGV